jgi:hypothetical protein
LNDYKRTNNWSLLDQALKEATEIKTPELTIDLPNNQKLTIGQLKPDTIVEIATWKGSGAPDENSVRMLIGASLQNGAEMAAQNEEAASAAVANAVDDVIEAIEAEGRTNEAATPKVDPRPMWSWPEIEEPVSEEEEVVTEVEPQKPAVSLGGPATPTAWDMVQKMERERSAEKQTEFQKEIGRKEARMMSSKKNKNFKLLASLGSFASIVLIIAGLNLSGLLAFDHPQAGPELPFGPSTNSLVAIVPNTPAGIGEFAMATINGERNLVRVDGVGADSYTVSTMSGPQVITSDQLDGKMSFLIPFVGFFWTIVGQ